MVEETFVRNEQLEEMDGKERDEEGKGRLWKLGGGGGGGLLIKLLFQS